MDKKRKNKISDFTTCVKPGVGSGSGSASKRKIGSGSYPKFYTCWKIRYDPDRHQNGKSDPDPVCFLHDNRLRLGTGTIPI
jgi:hypothetical protein